MATERMPLQEEVPQTEQTPPRDDVEVETTTQADVKETEPQPQDGKRGGKKEGAGLQEREPGKSVLPFSRVQKIIKADKELPMVARDATFLISLATEEFIRRLSQAGQRLAEREKRTTVQQKDVASVVRRVEEFLFLEEIIGSQESTGRRRPQKTRVEVETPGDQDQSQPTIHNFVVQSKENTKDVNQIIVDEDGVMYTE